MKRWIFLTVAIVLAGTLVTSGVFAVSKLSENEPAKFSVVKEPAQINQTLLVEYKAKLQAEAEAIAKAAAEKAAQEAAAQAQQSNTTSGKTLTYSVAVRGNPSSSLEEFRTQAAETLNDSRGWVRAGVHFREVASGGNFTLILSEAQYLPSYSSVCSVNWSCRVGSNVIINDDRWRGATDSWNSAGGGLRDYHHMVINHEVGHFLGHRDNVPVCAGSGQLAPLMQQQSIDLRGCTFNPWPLDQELWTKL